VDILDGEATFASPDTVTVDGWELSAPRIIVATGAAPTVPPIPGLDRVPHWTSDDLLLATELPERLVVIGAGSIALELGQAMARLGSRVTMVEMQPRLLLDAEPEIADMLRGYLEDDGIEMLTGAAIDEVRPGPTVVVRHEGVTRSIDGDVLLVATGRGPAVEALGLERAGIATGRTGVTVDARLGTTRSGSFAAGDVVGLPYGAFTSVARRMGVSVAQNALGLDPHDVDTDVGPTAMFTDPELATVGLTEGAARDTGHDVAIGTETFSGGKARAWGEERGMAKVVVDRADGRLLGAQVLAYHGADLIHTVAVAMKAPGGTAAPIVDAMHIHPTLGEVVLAAAKKASSDVAR
jgi:pyruvate/2-oxoglutarate dehydrogenase complex dihydrolipoamide dehydrogenase (E3) component